MTWALRRQILYIFLLISVFLVLGYWVYYPKERAPSCFDNTQNGLETGIDCGGICARACIAEVDPLKVLWSRSFKVVDGRYNALAYIENQNKNTIVKKINYKFRFADANNIYIGKREGSAYVPPSGRFAVFEPGIDVGNSTPVYTTFEFTEVPDWRTVSGDKINQLKLLVSNISLTDEDTVPKLSASIKNNSFFTIQGMDIVTILYDANHNAVSSSRTFLDSLLPNESKDVNFSWPEPFSSKVIEKEIIPTYDIDSAKLK